jgi:thiamine transport system substrate-binding protein
MIIRRRASTSPLPGALLALAIAAALLNLGGAAAGTRAADERTLRLLTHDSFYLPPEVIATFEAASGARLQVINGGDAGTTVNQAILTRLAGNEPLADVIYGVDNTFLSRALEAGVLAPYTSSESGAIAEGLAIESDLATPVDIGDVCLNIDLAAFGDGGLPVPGSLDDLLDPALAATLVVEDPATSSPGLAFLLATIATFGEDPATGWRAFWAGLRENGVEVASDWEEAYHERFSGGSGLGDRPIVVSYATSPVAEVLFGPDPEADVAPTRALEPGCFRQVEYAAVLAGAREPELAGAFIDFLLSTDAQAALPMAMYVLPVREDVALPEAFERHALRPAAPLTMDAAAIDAGREGWIDEWTDIVLR